MTAADKSPGFRGRRVETGAGAPSVRPSASFVVRRVHRFEQRRAAGFPHSLNNRHAVPGQAPTDVVVLLSHNRLGLPHPLAQQPQFAK
jgi:hypothetical protein